MGLYGRVSIDVSEGRSVDSQLGVGRQWAQREGHQVVGEYRDDGISAYTVAKSRPAWQQVMDDIVAKKMDVLWVWEASRASRDRAVWAALIAACAEARVLISVNGKNHDVTDPDDGFVLDLGMAMAVRESAYISKRVKRATLAAADAGRPFGSIPYGYRREYDLHSGSPVRQVPDEETAPIVREIVSRILAGEGLHRIAVDLNRRGVPTPQMVRDRRAGRETVQRGGWSNPKIRKLVSTPTIAGWRVHQGQTYGKAVWDGLVSTADHAAALAIINDPNRRTQRGTAPKYLLSGIAECGVCGGWMRRYPNRGHQSYGCAGRNNTNDGHVVRRAEPLDAMVIRHAVRRLEDPRLLEGLARDEGQEGSDAAAAAAELARLQEQVAEFEAEAIAQPRAAASFARVVLGLLDEIEAVKGRLSHVRAMPRVVLDAAGPAAQEHWDDHTDDIVWQRQVVRALMRVRVHRSNQRRGVRGFDPSSIEIIDL